MATQLMLYNIIAHGQTDVGLVRQNNEDSLSLLEKEHFYVLADGMGGHQAGEIASKEAVALLTSYFKEKIEPAYISLQQSIHLVSKGIKEVNRRVYHLGTEQDCLRGMGTTLCCVWIKDDGLLFGHVGDSRIYRFRGETLTQLTHDDSLLRELMDLGQLSEQQADDFLYKNILTKAIGTEPSVQPSVYCDSILANDIILICSDGLTDMLTDQEIMKIVSTTSFEQLTKKLIKTAKSHGGLDNITVIVVKVQEKNVEPNLS